MRACSITGMTGTGKTQRLIEDVVALLSEGATAEDILVMCATPLASQMLRARLGAAAVADASIASLAANVRVTTVRDVALDILSDEQAIAWSGRQPRMLLPYEESFYLEDSKTCGLKTARLREMSKFFYRSWTELADDDPDWLITGEERAVHGLLKDILTDMQGMLESEISNFAVNYLRTYEDARSRHQVAYVFVDDYLCISRASQILTCMLATNSITVAADEYVSAQMAESYPYAKGLSEFAQTYPDMQSVHLEGSHRCAPCDHAVQSLCSQIEPIAQDAAPSDAKGEDTVAKSSDQICMPVVIQAEVPEDEFKEIGDFVAAELKTTADAASIVVAVPNHVWGHRVGDTLRERGISAEEAAFPVSLRGDVRTLDHCIPARICAALFLVADPRDPIAWRAWCGFGDYLTNSRLISVLREKAKEDHLGFTAALEHLAANQAPFEDTSELPDMQPLVDAYQSGLELVQTLTGKTGLSLLESLTDMLSDGKTRDVPPSVISLCVAADGSVPENDNAATLAARLRHAYTTPKVRLDSPVLILPYDQLLGLSPEVLMIAGFVNGFIPCRDYFDPAQMPPAQQADQHLTDMRRAYIFATKAERTLAFSYFTKASLQTAESLKLQFERVVLQNGTRVCTIERSELFSYMFGDQSATASAIEELRP